MILPSIARRRRHGEGKASRLPILALVLLAAWAVCETLAIFATGGYTRELAGRALGRLGWGAALWVVLAMVGRRFRPAQLRIPPRRPDVQRPVRRLGLLRAALYALALLLLILGVGNQGMRDVLVKAIQICTECIGLG